MGSGNKYTRPKAICNYNSPTSLNSYNDEFYCPNVVQSKLFCGNRPQDGNGFTYTPVPETIGPDRRATMLFGRAIN